MEHHSLEPIETSMPVEQPAARVWRGWGVAALLVLILLLGAVFRLAGVNWDELQHLHPDERFLTMVTSAITFPGTESFGPLPPGCNEWGGYFDTQCSPLNPYNHNFGLFVYGTLPIFLTRLAGDLVNQTGYDQIHIVGRVMSALFDLSTVLLIFFIGRRLYGVRAGLLGALLLTGSVLDIQQSHFFTVDTFTNVPILIAFWYALDIADGKKWPAFVLAGLAFGLALAGRINIAPFAAVLIAAAALRAYRQAEESRNAVEPHTSDGMTPSPTPEAEREVSANGDAPDGTEWQGAPVERSLADGPEPVPTASQTTVSTRAPAAETSPVAQTPASVSNHSLGPVSVSYAWNAPQERAPESFQEALSSAVTRALVGMAIAALVTLVIFRIGQPYAATGPSFITPHVPQLDLSHGPVPFLFDVALSWAGGVNPKFADNMSYIGDLVSGKIDFPPGHQWADRTPYVFPFDNMVLWGLGLPLGLAAWAGFALALYQLLRYRRWEHLLILVWVGLTFAYTGQQFVKTMRYFLQIYPFLALLGGWFIVELWDHASGWITTRGGTQVVSTPVGASPRWRRPAQAGVLALGLVVAGYTLFWAGAFTTIYTRPVSRITASRWIFDNVPKGSAIANEHWDDPLPLRVDGKDPYGGMYRGLASSADGLMHWYDEDTPEKRVQAIHWLDDADYIVLSSNRLYGSIPRLPMRYPMTTKYYQWLFDGTLGFERVATITSRPQLFGIEINDDDAEEAYTVYDHPKVLIFKKTPQYSHANAEALLGSVDLTEVYRFFPATVSQAKTALLLTPDEWNTQMQGGTWAQIFNPDDWINKIPVIGWLLILEILGWLAFPIAFIVFRAFRDRGYIFAKALGILFPAWGAWMLASLHLVGFSRFSIVFVLLFILLATAIAIRLRWRQLLAFLHRERTLIVVEQVLFLAFFGLDLAIRYGNPDLWHQWFGGEKPMDFAYLNAIIKSTWFPPYDPWFAGGFIDYYYFGQLITATLVRLSGIVPEVAYNLALPTYFALLAMGAFSVVLTLTGRIGTRAIADAAAKGPHPVSKRLLICALLGALLVAVIGNLGELMLIAQLLIKAGGGEGATQPIIMLTSLGNGIMRVILDHQSLQAPLHWWYWNASRVIPDTINEFPNFTFLYADLHAHLMALPFTVLVLGLAVNFALRTRLPEDSARMPFWPYAAIAPVAVVEVLVAALALGSLRAINLADYLTYPIVIACGIAIGEYSRRGRIDLAGIIAFGVRFGAVFVLSSLLYQPFISHFATASASVEIWKGARTTLGEYLTVHGIFLFPIATFLIWQLLATGAVRSLWRLGHLIQRYPGRIARILRLQRALAPLPWYGDFVIVILIATLLVETVFLITEAYVFALVLPFLILAGLLLLKPDLDPARRFVLLLISAGLALTLAVELVRYKDDIGRMNTVFKFYLEVWVFLAIAAAAGLAYLTQRGRWSLPACQAERLAYLPLAARSAPRLWWWLVLGVLLFIGFLYPVLAGYGKVNDRFVAGTPAGLNGMEYMHNAVYQEQKRDQTLEFDWEAIQWLWRNVEGSPVILEANGPLYHWTSRVSINTGLPTVIGWDWHQKQQRSIIEGTIIDRRIQDVATIYNTKNIPEAVKLLDRFHVSYIYLGDMEYAMYDESGFAKFDTMVRNGQLELVYQNEHVKIFRVHA